MPTITLTIMSGLLVFTLAIVINAVSNCVYCPLWGGEGKQNRNYAFRRQVLKEKLLWRWLAAFFRYGHQSFGNQNGMQKRAILILTKMHAIPHFNCMNDYMLYIESVMNI